MPPNVGRVVIVSFADMMRLFFNFITDGIQSMTR